MGIRVNKIIGYGLTDLHINKDSYNITDDQRFNPDGYFSLDYVERDKKFNVANFLDYLKQKELQSNNFEIRLLLSELEKEKKLIFEHYFAWDSEFGDPKTCVFVPPTCSEWWRNDDAIDYYHETVINEQKTNTILLNRPIYPFSSWINIKDFPPKIANRQTVELRNLILYHNKEFEITNEMVHKLKLEFDNIDEIMEYIVPTIPFELVEFLSYLKVFNNPNTIYQLRPLLYTYWS